MNHEIDILKGIHPGFVLEKKIKEQDLKKGRLALLINEYPQTLTAITKGKRAMNLKLALKLEEALGLEQGYFMLLQLYYDINQEKLKKNSSKPDLSKFRSVLFWDTDMTKIDWERQSKAIIRRVFERGNEEEKKEISSFYDIEKINQALNRFPPK